MATKHFTDEEKAQKLMDLMSSAYAGQYVQNHAELKQSFLKWGKQLEAHPKNVNQVAFQIRTTLLDIMADGGVKPLDPSLEALGSVVLKIAKAKIGQPGGWATMFYPGD